MVKMSMNKYMHPRNIYKNPPNFKELAVLYPEFRKHVKQDVSGKVTMDFKDVHALRALSRTLLLRDFDLNVEMPEDKLIPTIPLRLNYLLWIEDLLSLQKINCDQIHGIDIGTGASCVYPLMAASKFKWNMIGIEIEETSIEYAQKNVTMNLLNDKIQIHKSSGETFLTEIVLNTKKTFNFCMCNPPFFSSTQELHPFFKSRKSSRPHPKNAFCASVNEVVSNGGEVKFISKLIEESSVLKDKIIIYTTMVGHKSNLIPLKKLLKERDVCSFKQTEFCQGNTTRWGLAWTFCDIDLRAIPTILKNSKCKSKSPFIFIVPNSESRITFENANKIVAHIIRELKLKANELKKHKNLVIYDVEACSNTWSNQRRKRREKNKNCEKLSPSLSVDDNQEKTVEISPNSEVLKSDQNERTRTSSPIENSSDLQDTSIKLAEMELNSGTPKREYEEDDDEDECYYHKKFKVNNNNNDKHCYAKFSIAIKIDSNHIVLELFSLDNDTNRETIHQILQYIKNNWDNYSCSTSY